MEWEGQGSGLLLLHVRVCLLLLEHVMWMACEQLLQQRPAAQYQQQQQQ
jgi:hypothetical protein